MADTEPDAATGEEFVYFVRRGRPFLFLRDAESKAFIRKLSVFGVKVTFSLEYTSPKTPSKNVYIDVTTESNFPFTDFPARLDKDQPMIDTGYNAVRQLFGSALLSDLEEHLIGTEYLSEGVFVDYPRAHVILAWAHRDRSLTKTEQEVFVDAR